MSLISQLVRTDLAELHLGLP